MINDGYAQFYADRLWQMVPPIYRTLDEGPTPGSPGPLRELINRIGSQAAVVRRSVDRLWENQSIETCDDWVIPYIGDLVATRIVSCLDAPAQRTDVAKTIYYRRHAGTVGVLEELAADIASRDARVVEFFRRLGRTRHQFDPPLSYQIENPITGPQGFTGDALEVIEGLIGAYSSTPAGGFADLRNPYAASNVGSPFDEYFYTADLRAGGQTLGHFNIRNLGVFIWWLQAFPISAATPVSNGAADPTKLCFTFDPTGRDIPLFAPSQRVNNAKSWGEHWVSPDEWELPVAIREILWKTVPNNLYATNFAPQAFSVGLLAGGSGGALPAAGLSIHPHRGRFSFVGMPPVGTLAVCYNFGQLGQVGAGGFDNSILTSLTLPAVSAPIAGGKVADLNTAFAAVSSSANIEIRDSLTYTVNAAALNPLNVPAGATVALCAQNEQRPVIRWTAPGTQTWTIQGAPGNVGTPTVLVLEGFLAQGADIVLQGNFDSVYLRMMTLDPGTAYVPPANPPANPPFFQTAIDGLLLKPTTLWIEGTVTNLYLERCITGPIRIANGGALEQMTATDSIIQSIPTPPVVIGGQAGPLPVLDGASLARALKQGKTPLAKNLVAGSKALETELAGYAFGAPSQELRQAMSEAIRNVPSAQARTTFPLALADLALGFDDGTVSLSRCTVMGPTVTHRISVSESVLDDVATVDDPQTGCVRFSAYATGSTLHQPYRCVQVAPRASLFVSRSFGQPGYAQLRSDADSQILPAGSGTANCGCPSGTVADAASILTGAQNGSEMGVYCSENIPLKRRGLALKYEEYAPIGQLPVWIDED